MKVKFRIQYNTVWGQGLTLISRDVKYPMQWEDGGYWSVTLPKCTAADLNDYTYVVTEDGLIRRTEWKHHSRKAEAGRKELLCNDSWIDCPIEGCPFLREHQLETSSISNIDNNVFLIHFTAELLIAHHCRIPDFRNLRRQSYRLQMKLL